MGKWTGFEGKRWDTAAGSLIEAHARHVEKVQILGVIEGLYFREIAEGMNWTDMVEDDVQDEAHPLEHSKTARKNN